MSCSRGTCFSAFSWRRAPTKSRLTMTSECAWFAMTTAAQKKTWGSPTSGAAVQLCEVYTRDRGWPFEGHGRYAPGSMDQIVLWTVVAARVLVPLGVFRFPLPVMLASLVIDGLD